MRISNVMPLAGNRHPAAGQHAEQTPPGWSFTAMAEAVQRLAKAEAANLAQALAAVSEAVWWVTVTDAALARSSPYAYDHMLATLDPASRRATMNTLAGLRFIRNQAGYHADPADFIRPRPGTGNTDDLPPAAWTWHPAPHTAGAVPRQGKKARDPSLYREYRAQLAGQPVTQSISEAAAFLAQVHECAHESWPG
jgi:hypothetical protein